MRILIVEDDATTAGYLSKGLGEAGHVVDTVADGRDALQLAIGNAFDVITVDRMIPGFDGLTLVRALRAAQVKAPILFLTAMSGIDDRVAGLEAGGDDYLVKPFAFSEFMARVNALGRRQRLPDANARLVVADLELDLLTRNCRRAGAEIPLLPREFELLHILMQTPGRVVTRTMLLERIWSFHFDPETSVVETLVSRLRAKIDKPFDRPLLHTVRASGYCIRA